MKEIKSDFYNWLKKNVNSTSPSPVLDKKILEIANAKLEQKSHELWFYSLGSFASVVAIFLVGNLYLNQNSNVHNFAFREAPEMISIYDNVELMADATKLSEQDWKQIEGKQ